jgi:hypothetical protein
MIYMVHNIVVLNSVTWHKLCWTGSARTTLPTARLSLEDGTHLDFTGALPCLGEEKPSKSNFYNVLHRPDHPKSTPPAFGVTVDTPGS